MTLEITRIAQHLQGELEGDATLSLRGMAEISAAQADQLCFAESEQYLEALRASHAGAVIVPLDFPALAGKVLIRVANPRLGFIRAMELFAPDHGFSGVHPSAVVAKSADLGEGVGIGPNVVVEEGAVIGAGACIRAGAYIGAGAVVGADTDIGPGVSILHDCRIGERCLLHPGVCIGADGYGFRWLEDHHHKIPQLGRVVVEDDVEIGANSCIDRATLGETRIGAGTKLDNLVHIAHNNRVGRHVIMTALVGIAGSSEIGDRVVLAGQAGVIDHVKLGDDVQVMAKSLVTKDIPARSTIWGIPARPMARAMKQLANLTRLPGLLRRVQDQQAQIDALQARISELERSG